jgi:hypothetical protein
LKKYRGGPQENCSFPIDEPRINVIEAFDRCRTNEHKLAVGKADDKEKD